MQIKLDSQFCFYDESCFLEIFFGLYRFVSPIWNPQIIDFLLISIISLQSQQILRDTLKPWYKEPRYSELLDIVNKKGLTDLFTISRFECTCKCKQTFSAKNLFTKILISQNFFMLNQTFWGYFLDHIDLPYQFRILIMSTYFELIWMISQKS